MPAGRATPTEAAMTMLTMSAASNTSRKTMTATASNGASTCDKVSTRRRIEVVEKVVCARSERSDIDNDLLTGRDDFLATQLETFEFGRGSAFIRHVQLDLLPGRHIQFRRDELVVLNRNRECWVLSMRGTGKQQHHGQQPARRSP